MSTPVETYRFSVEEYNQLIDAGIFGREDPIELLNGELIVMAPHGKRHVSSIRRLNRKLHLLFGDLCVVDCQLPVILDDFSEPQPDILLLRPELETTGEIARPEDIFVAVEVADSSLRYDSTLKLRAYARAGVREYWIVNLTENRIDVYRQPSGETYTEHFRRERADQLAPAAFPNRPIAVADILP